jgi:outer membrane lipoprotein carrier protein
MTRHRNPNSFWTSDALAASRWLLFIGLIAWFTVGARAQAPTKATDAEDYIAKFETSYHDVHSLKAEFNQTYLMGNRTRIESGNVCFARGGLMRWDYQRPMEKLFVSDGKQVALYIPEEHQLTRSSMKASDDYRIPFELLLTRLNLKKVFARMEVADGALDHDAGDRVLRAYPKKEFAEEYASVLIELNPEFDMRRLVVNYPDHSRMAFLFDHIERNPALPTSFFQFTPPVGTEIIDQH